jgi:nicotinic acid phosphoribosyltransferase
VSGGFTPHRIEQFEREHVPVDAYAVGSAFFDHAGKYDFTADIVALQENGAWHECHKVGRPERPNPRLENVK